jgi:plasmid maintenance system antidote protein VapI
MSVKKFAETLGGEWNERKVQDIIDGKEKLNEKTAEAFGEALQVPAHFWWKLQHQCSHYEKKQIHDEKGSLKPWKKAV